VLPWGGLVEKSVCCVWKIAILCVIVSDDKNVICNKKSWKKSCQFAFIMTRLPAILNVINNKCCGTFQARSWIIFHFQGKDSTRAWLAKLSTHSRRNIYVFHPNWSIKPQLIDLRLLTVIKRFQMNEWLFMVEVYPVRYSKQRIYFITGSFDFPNIANCV
jgi:hypothetical protein